MTSPASRRTVRACLAMIVAGLLMTSRLTASAAAPQDAGVQLEQKIEALLKKMTLEEKVSLLSGKDGGELKAIPRLGIPALRVTDGPHGVGWGTKSTAFPTGVSMGSTWNPALIAKVGVALGRETRAAGRHVLLGPCVCIHRTPLGGRNFESFAEDPYLAGKIAAAYVRGVQSQKIGTSTKHYACNNQEWERTTISVEVDERTLREIYLPAFRAAVEEGGTWTIMGAYNKVNGDYCCANRHLLTDILKKDWGFGGVVVSDWGATHSTLDSALAGLDLEMPGPGEFFSDALLKAARDGRVPGEVIDDKVRRILRVLAWCGLLDGSARSFKGAASTPEHQALCRRVAEEAIVLLKNAEGVLPLNRNAIKSIAVIGPNAAYARVGGGGSSTVTPPHTVSPLDGLRALCGEGMKVEYVQGVRFPTDMTIIEAKHLRPPAGVEGAFGLRGEYFSNRELEGEPVVTRLDRNVAFRWGDESPDPRVPADKFSARWTGKLVPPKSGTYRLGMSSDDGIRLYVDDELLVDHWVDHGPTIMLNDIALEAGREYDLRIEFHESAGGATAELGWALPDDGVLEQAVELARDCDAAVVCVGLTYEIEGEGVDRSTMHLPAGQEELIKAVAAANPKTVVVLVNGTPVDMRGWLDAAPAIVEAWYPGQEGGHALARVLFGDVNPSGKLPVTFPKRLEDNPSHGNYPGGGGRVDYAEGIHVGYRHYDTKGVEPQFPFGHGLSYTSFEYGNLKVSPGTASKDTPVTVTVDVQNTGSRPGAEVVQLYVHDVESGLPRPLKELKAFEKITLAPGEKKTVKFTLGRDALSFYDPDRGGWVAEPGEFEVMVGSSSRDIRLQGVFGLE